MIYSRMPKLTKWSQCHLIFDHAAVRAHISCNIVARAMKLCKEVVYIWSYVQAKFQIHSLIFNRPTSTVTHILQPLCHTVNRMIDLLLWYLMPQSSGNLKKLCSVTRVSRKHSKTTLQAAPAVHRPVGRYMPRKWSSNKSNCRFIIQKFATFTSSILPYHCRMQAAMYRGLMCHRR